MNAADPAPPTPASGAPSQAPERHYQMAERFLHRAENDGPSEEDQYLVLAAIAHAALALVDEFRDDRA